ncbi:2'-5' RNA ligase family protein [Nocardia sp. NPDC055053]
MHLIVMSDRPPHENRAGALGYYWFLTFEHAAGLHAAARYCQQVVDSSRFELTPLDTLHLTLDRIAAPGSSTPEQRAAILEAGTRRCQNLAPFVLTVDRVANLRGAVAFICSPGPRIEEVRGAARAATQSVSPAAPVRDSSSAPHMTIAYPMYEGLTAEAAATARAADLPGAVAVSVSAVCMVALERRGHGYRWETVGRAPLAKRDRVS